jgi:DNA-binding transcriptional ArsR family regulator
MVDRQAVQALGHPTRVQILDFLRGAEVASPTTMSTELGIPLGSIGYHVRRLEALGFLELVRRVQRRGAFEHFYRLAPGAGAEERVASASRDLLARTEDVGAAWRALLDARAIAALRPSVDDLFARMRALEAETAQRTGVDREARALIVDVLFLVDDSD